MRRSNLILILIAVLTAAGALGMLLSRPSAAPASSPSVNVDGGTPAGVANENPFLAAIQSSETRAPEPAVEGSFLANAGSIVLHLVIAVGLSAILAFRPRKNFPLFRRNLYVAQTQILLSAVAAALMMIVGDNAARAFAIFAAVSIVRFRTNIRDPKEVTVLLISLALGLAAGVGRWDLGVALCGFALVLLWLLEYKEQEQALRSMELTINTRDIRNTQSIMGEIFRGHKLDAEIRKIDPSSSNSPVGCIQYYLNLRLNLSTDDLSEQLMDRDPNIEMVQWSKTKNATDVYQ